MAKREEAGVVRFLVIRYDGRIASGGTLPLDQYAKSLAGWQHLIEIATDVVLRADPATARLRAKDVIRVDALAEREGSYEFWLGYGAGIAQNATWDGIKSIPKLVRFLARLIRTHTDTKKKTYDVDKIVAALEAMTEAEGLTPVALPQIDDQMRLAATDETYDVANDPDPLPDPPAKRAFVDKVDRSIKDAASPIGGACDTIDLQSAFSETPILRLDSEDKLAIDAPLVAMPSQMTWRAAVIKFVRINRKTGRALFYFADDPKGEDNAHYSTIADVSVHLPENVYTDAFNRDIALHAYIRHTAAERGSVRTMWEIVLKPNDDELFR
jgi:hypothetical protein